MNDRMTELYAKACLDARDIHPADVPAFIACMAEKLSESIVQECVEQCSKALVEHTGQPSVTHNYAVGLCQDNIKEHFGVEEK